MGIWHELQEEVGNRIRNRPQRLLVSNKGCIDDTDMRNVVQFKDD